MDISNWPFWYWVVAFFACPVGVFLFAGRLFPIVRNERLKSIFKLVDVGGLVVACIVAPISFVMMWQSLVGWGYLSCLLFLTIPIALIIDFVIWQFGIQLLIAKSGISSYTVVFDTNTYDGIQEAWVVVPKT